MLSAATIALALLAAAPLLCTAALAMQALAMLTLAERRPARLARRPAIAVLVPAHDEAAGIGTTVRGLKARLSEGDQLLVVADNCSDDTAERAREAGAEVLVREDREARGKGHALAAGLRRLDLGSVEVVVFVDADCRFERGGPGRLARICAALQAPVQCRNLMTAPAGERTRSGLGEFAFRLRNDFRPAGYARLGLPCQLFGTGMAMPASMIRPERFATGHVTEDLLIGIEAALAGRPPRYVRTVTLLSDFPTAETGRAAQKRRWIHGHLAVIGSHWPKLAARAARERSLALFAMAMDLLVPPLTLLAAAHCAALGLGAAWWLLTGSAAPFAVAALGAALLALSLLAAWLKVGRDVIGRRELGQLPAHALRVAAAIGGFAAGRRSRWIRASRS